MTTQPTGWDSAYEAGSRAPWDIGRPQPAFVRLADGGLLRGRVLDAGCGTGEHALLAAARGADAVGVDISPRAIGQARRKAAERGLAVRFEVGDALSLDELGLTFDTVIDSGLFHVFDDADRARYVASLASVLRVRRHLLPDVLQRAPAGRHGAPPGPPGGAAHRLQRRLGRHRHRGGGLRGQPRAGHARPRRHGWPPSAGCDCSRFPGGYRRPARLRLPAGYAILSGGSADGPPRPRKGDEPP